MTDPILVDAHEDLAYNILTFGRDYTLSAFETRRLEAGSFAPQVNGDTLLGWPEYQKARAAVVFGTLFSLPERRREGNWERLMYGDVSEAHHVYRIQVETYYDLADKHPNHFRLIFSRQDLDDTLIPWKNESSAGDEDELCPRH